MVEFLLLSFMFFFKPILFFLFIVMFSFVLFKNIAWSGVFFVVDSNVFVLLIFMISSFQSNWQTTLMLFMYINMSGIFLPMKIFLL